MAPPGALSLSSCPGPPLVHAAGAVALQIQCNVGKPGILEFRQDPAAHLIIKDSRQFVKANLDTGRVAMVADPKGMKILVAHERFTAVDLLQTFRSDACSVGKARGETGERLLVGSHQAAFPAQGADLVLGQPGLEEGGADFEFTGRLPAGAVVVEVIEVGAIQDHCITEFHGFVQADMEQLFLAMVAALRRVVGKAGDFQFITVNNDLLDAEFAGQPDTLVEFMTGIGRRRGCQGNHLFGAEDFTSRVKEKSGIYTAGKSDHRRTQLRENSPQFLVFRCNRHDRKKASTPGRRPCGLEN